MQSCKYRGKHDKELQVAIKVMQKKNIQLLQVMDILQDQKINFSLVTGLREDF
jgi:mRNA-degrading endonuclease YafQ of YafQ-DinJ toxin-antitoxin module